MDILTRFWERQTKWLAKIEGIAAIATAIFLIVGLLTMKSEKSFGFVMIILSFWCFGIAMVYELWHVDERGVSRIRSASPIHQFITSAFYILWFVLLTFITIALLIKINS